MVNLRKSIIATTETEILGLRWATGGYFQVEGKKLRNLINASPAEIHSMSRAKIYGILSAYREHLPDFASITEPLREMLSNDAIPWTDEHTALAQRVGQQLLES